VSTADTNKKCLYKVYCKHAFCDSLSFSFLKIYVAISHQKLYVGESHLDYWEAFEWNLVCRHREHGVAHYFIWFFMCITTFAFLNSIWQQLASWVFVFKAHAEYYYISSQSLCHALWGLVDIAPHLGGQMSYNLQKRAWTDIFMPNQLKLKFAIILNWHIISRKFHNWTWVASLRGVPDLLHIYFWLVIAGSEWPSRWWC